MRTLAENEGIKRKIQEAANADENKVYSLFSSVNSHGYWGFSNPIDLSILGQIRAVFEKKERHRRDINP